jgi:alkylation response protein AidB-like acyl-CoA dehydrogenase
VPGIPASDLLERVNELGPLIRANAQVSQQLRRLPDALVEAFHDAGLFRMLVGQELGGNGLREIEAVRVVEAIARHDASAAWSVMIANSSAGYARALEPAVTAEILADPHAVIAGVINPHAVTFRAVDGGFLLGGQAPFASGCTHASWFGGGGLLRGDAGASRYQPGSLLLAFVPSSQGEILDTWNVTGLRGSGSHDILFRDVFVPGRYVANNDDVPATRAGATVAAVAVGTARRAIEEFVALAVNKPAFGSRSRVSERADAQMAVARATGLVEAASALLTGFMADYPDRTRGGPPQTAREEALLRMACTTAAELAVQAVDLIATAAGTSTLPEDSIIGLCWRDAHAVQQNLSVQPKHYQPIGEQLMADGER